jgi:hypothetical protein
LGGSHDSDARPQAQRRFDAVLTVRNKKLDSVFLQGLLKHPGFVGNPVADAPRSLMLMNSIMPGLVPCIVNGRAERGGMN